MSLLYLLYKLFITDFTSDTIELIFQLVQIKLSINSLFKNRLISKTPGGIRCAICFGKGALAVADVYGTAVCTQLEIEFRLLNRKGETENERKVSEMLSLSFILGSLCDKVSDSVI